MLIKSCQKLLMKNPQKLTRKECMTNLYKVIGVHRMASPKMIKAAYEIKKAGFTDDLESLQNLKMAYAILISPDLRAEYDAFQDMGGMRWSMPRGTDIMNRGLVVAGSFGG